MSTVVAVGQHPWVGDPLTVVVVVEILNTTADAADDATAVAADDAVAVAVADVGNRCPALVFRTGGTAVVDKQYCRVVACVERHTVVVGKMVTAMASVVVAADGAATVGAMVDIAGADESACMVDAATGTADVGMVDGMVHQSPASGSMAPVVESVAFGVGTAVGTGVDTVVVDMVAVDTAVDAIVGHGLCGRPWE